MNDEEIVGLAMKNGFLIDRDAVNIIKNFSDKREIYQVIKRAGKFLKDSDVVITPDHINDVCFPHKSENKTDLRIRYDTNVCKGEYEEFTDMFIDRYRRLGKILKRRLPASAIKNVKKRGGGSDIFVVGMVSNIQKTRNGHKIVEMEDETDLMSVLLPKGSDVIKDDLLLDEVIGVKGSIKGGRRNILIADTIFRPDLPVNRERLRSHGKIGLTSDLHVGSVTFKEDSWKRFVKFLQRDEEVAGDLDCIIVAGDVVDGIGIYPNQERELSIKNIFDQYREAANLMEDIPSDIKVVISPGNHDAVRQAEPQPPFPEKIRDFFPERFKFVGNPCYIEMNGVNVLSYHGRSLDDIIQNIPGSSYNDPVSAMTHLLKRRHLSPIYGGRVAMSPGERDLLLMGDVPDIFHCGHVHTLGIGRYSGTLIVNSAGWQEQTSFQRERNIEPDVAKFPVIDLGSMGIKILDFGG